MGNSAAYFKEGFQRTEHPTSEPESPICAPVQNLIDPRSPTDQFHRTPIEVAGLPIKIRSRMNSAYVRESPGPTARGSYLKSDDISESPKVEEAMKMLRRLRLLSDDPRSPSIGILRTPIQVESTPDDVYHKSTEEESTPADCLVTDIPLEDLVFPPFDSPITSGNRQKLSLPDPRSSTEESAHTPNQLEDPSDSLNHQIIDACVTSQSGDSESNCNTEEPGDVTDNQSKSRKSVAGRVTPVKLNKTNEDCLIRKLFSDPDSKEHLMQAPPKARTPLQTVSANGITPQQILRVKQSRGINQEIGRLTGIENTPPDTLTKNKQLQKYNMSPGWEPDSTIVL